MSPSPLAMDELGHPKSYIEALTPDVTVFSNGASREVIKIKWGSGGSKMVAE